MDAPPYAPAMVAHRLLTSARAGAGRRASASETGERVLVRLREQLGRWIGKDAFDALVERACATARDRHPELSRLAWGIGDPPTLRGLKGAAPDVCFACVETILAGIVERLGRFIGEEMAARLVLDGWTEAEGPAPDVGKED